MSRQEDPPPIQGARSTSRDDAAAKTPGDASETNSDRAQAADASSTVAPLRKGLGRTSAASLWTLVVLLVVVVILHHQLRERSSVARVERSVTSDPNLVPRPHDTIAGQDASRASAAARGVIRIVDPSGQPVARAVVRTDGDPPSETSADGLAHLPFGNGRLTVSHADYWPRTLDRSQLDLLREAAFGDVPKVCVFPSRRLRGVVRQGNEALADATVLVSAGPPERGHRLWSLRTEADGRFESPPLPLERAQVMAFSPRGVPLLRRLTLATGGGEETVFELDLGPAFHCTVRDVRGQPIDQAAVSVRHYQGEERGPWRTIGYTDLKGELQCALDTVSAPLQIRFVRAGYVTARRPLLGSSANVKLRAAPTVRGVAVNARTGLPVDVLSIDVERIGASSGEPAGLATTVLERGRFVIARPDAGRCRLVVRAHGLAGRSPEIDLAPEIDLEEVAAGDIPVLLHPVAEVYGRFLSPAGEPLSDTAVALCAVQEGDSERVHGVAVPAISPAVAETTTGPDGTFQLSSVRPGLYFIRATHAGFEEYVSPALVAPVAGEVVVRRVAGARLRGRLLGSDGVPVPYVEIVLAHRDVRRRTTTAGDGRYSFDDLPAGEYTLILVRQGHVETRTVNVDRGRERVYNVRLRSADVGGSLDDGPAEDGGMSLSDDVDQSAR